QPRARAGGVRHRRGRRDAARPGDGLHPHDRRAGRAVRRVPAPAAQLAYLVLLIVWFGIGEESKIILLFLAALPVSAVAARAGVRGVSLQRVQVARTLGASEWQIFRHVVFPSALDEIFIGARLAIGIVYGTLIAAEIIAGSTGLGWMILDAGRFLRSDYVFVGIFLIGLMGIALDRLLVAIEARVVHWAGR
ncbi:MAG: ABC transporter permease subunit, partial [Acidisphaera sp.]|nr:ABC transporter permease subunit [Acidisphaera sp.]